MSPSFLREILACISGVMVGGFFAHIFILPPVEHNHDLDIAHNEEYHVHTDFRIYIEDEQLDLSADKYKTTAKHEHGYETHLHDNEGGVEHIHAENVSFASFLDSIGLKLTDDCLTTDDQKEYCRDESNVLEMFVNGEQIDTISEYIPVDEDRILLYFGEPNNPKIEDYINEIPSDACLYSGTCPERGVAPPENCGLTCEL
ncbi:hypothetical protein H6785_01375 [Candidatus Nomurabacteria bacterium]|nr:hypothetical protein [Candidatus Kaiserbacteria bacterium]MCB9815221.1 hypothetical protein [Candidatus Nomurabacteria bacterium]